MDKSGFDFVAGAGGYRHDLVFFARPTTDGRKNERKIKKIRAFEVGQDPFIKNIGGGEGTFGGIYLLSFLLHSPDDHA